MHIKQAMFTCIRESLSKLGSLNNPTFNEEQNSKLLLTTEGKLIFNERLPETFPYINEPTNHNLQIETPDKYFIEGTVNVKEAYPERGDRPSVR